MAGWGSIVADDKHPVIDYNLYELTKKPIMKVSKCAEMWFFQKLNKKKSYSMWDLIDKLKWNKSLYEVIRGLNFCLSLQRLCDSGQGSGDVSQLLLLHLKYTFYCLFFSNKSIG